MSIVQMFAWVAVDVLIICLAIADLNRIPRR